MKFRLERSILSLACISLAVFSTCAPWEWLCLKAPICLIDESTLSTSPSCEAMHANNGIVHCAPRVSDAESGTRLLQGFPPRRKTKGSHLFALAQMSTCVADAVLTDEVVNKPPLVSLAEWLDPTQVTGRTSAGQTPGSLRGPRFGYPTCIPIRFDRLPSLQPRPLRLPSPHPYPLRLPSQHTPLCVKPCALTPRNPVWVASAESPATAACAPATHPNALVPPYVVLVNRYECRAQCNSCHQAHCGR